VQSHEQPFSPTLHVGAWTQVQVVAHALTVEPTTQVSGVAGYAKQVTIPGFVGAVLQSHEQPFSPTLHVGAWTQVQVVAHALTVEPTTQVSFNEGYAKHETCPGGVGSVLQSHEHPASPTVHVGALEQVHVVPHMLALEPISQLVGVAGMARHVAWSGPNVACLQVHVQPSTPTSHVSACAVA
jgi:hypothetical protein